MLSQGWEKTMSDCPGQVKMNVWWSDGQVILTSVVRLQDEKNNDLQARIDLKSKHTLLVFVEHLLGKFIIF